MALEALCFGISHFPKRVRWSFHVDNLLLVLARSVPLNKVRKRFIAVFVHPQVPGVRERVNSDSICYVSVCCVSWFLRAFNARAHASIYIYINIYICIYIYIELMIILVIGCQRVVPGCFGGYWGVIPEYVYGIFEDF